MATEYNVPGNLLGIYEKALPVELDWPSRLKTAGDLGFDFVEMSIDETDMRLERLDWDKETRLALKQAIDETGIGILTICLSGHRRFPFGSKDPEIRRRAMDIMAKAIDLAADLGIRVIQLAGYDVYYENSTAASEKWFLEGLRWSAQMAARRQVMLAVEIMDTPYINSITRYLWFDEQVNSPWLTVYPDLGNLSAWGNDVAAELRKGISRTIGIHVKETLAVTSDFPGQFKEVPFGTGCVDFDLCFQTLKALQYAGPFVIEMWTGKGPGALEEVKAARAFVIGKMKAAGLDIME